MIEELSVIVKNANSDKRVTTIVYALQAASFLFGVTFIVAVIINYVKKDDVRGTWLESHFRWQIRTFWFTVFWTIIGVILTVIIVGFVILLVVAVWCIYRIVKGWLRLNDEKEMYV